MEKENTNIWVDASITLPINAGDRTFEMEDSESNAFVPWLDFSVRFSTDYNKWVITDINNPEREFDDIKAIRWRPSADDSYNEQELSIIVARQDKEIGDMKAILLGTSLAVVSVNKIDDSLLDLLGKAADRLNMLEARLKEIEAKNP